MKDDIWFCFLQCDKILDFLIAKEDKKIKGKN